MYLQTWAGFIFWLQRCFLSAMTLAEKRKNNPGMFMLLGACDGWQQVKEPMAWSDRKPAGQIDSETLKYKHRVGRQAFPLILYLPHPISHLSLFLFFAKLRSIAAERRNKCTDRNFLTCSWLSRQVSDNNSLRMWGRVGINHSNQRVL